MRLISLRIETFRDVDDTNEKQKDIMISSK